MVPDDCRYTKEHEWVRRDGAEVVIGITDFAQSQLGDIVFVELPAVGTAMTQMAPFGSVEAVKAVSELFSPINGSISAVNGGLKADPTLVNRDPHGEGWMIRARPADASEVDALLTPEAYRTFVAELEAGQS